MSKYVKNTIALELSEKLNKLGIKFKFGVKAHRIDPHEKDKRMFLNKTYYTNNYSFEIETEKAFTILDISHWTYNQYSKKEQHGYKIVVIDKERVFEKGYLDSNHCILKEKTLLDIENFDDCYDENDKEIIAKIEDWVEELLNLIILFLE